MTSYTSTVTIHAVRRALRAEFGKRKYRVTRDGEIHVHGPFPNSIGTGWWLYGLASDTTTRHRLGLRA